MSGVLMLGPGWFGFGRRLQEPAGVKLTVSVEETRPLTLADIAEMRERARRRPSSRRDASERTDTEGWLLRALLVVISVALVVTVALILRT